MSLINPSIGIVLPSSTALLTALAILITIEYISKNETTIYKFKRLDWCNYIVVWENFTQSMVDKNIDEEKP